MKAIEKFDEIFEMGRLEPHLFKKIPVTIRAVKIPVPFKVKTREGVMRGKPGDYLIEGVAKEVYPCDVEIFKATYERVE